MSDSRSRISPMIRGKSVEALGMAATDRSGIGVGTNGTSPHQLYRYPARFSPRFAAAAIQLVSEPGDIVLDPFMGSGTTVIEALRHNRKAIGIDISPISTFLVRSLLRSSKSHQNDSFYAWFRTRLYKGAQNIRSLKIDPTLPTENLDLVVTWRHLRLTSYLISLGSQKSPSYDRLTRQILLRTCQWAFDVKSASPSFRDFFNRLDRCCVEVIATCHSFGEYMDEECGRGWRRESPEILEGSSSQVLSQGFLKEKRRVDAVITSPPYPGVHVLYGRWQYKGRRETDLPLWIIGSSARLREGDYTMYSRRDKTNDTYFDLLSQSMLSVRRVLKSTGYMVQMVGFNDPPRQLERFVKTVERAGFTEVRSKRLATWTDERLWRDVPSRRWYANAQGNGTHTKKEVVLIFKARD